MTLSRDDLLAELTSLQTQLANAKATVLAVSGAIQLVEHLLDKLRDEPRPNGHDVAEEARP